MTAATLPGTTDGVLHDVGDLRTDAYLPAPTVQSHAANLMVLPDGTLGCVWFGGTQEGVPDISVWYSRLEPGTSKWSVPQQLSDDNKRSEQNPILFVAPDGAVWLLYTAQFAGNQDTSEVRCRISKDGGKTFGPVRVLIPAGPQGGVFVRQPPVVMSDGRWLLPVFNCVTVPGERWAGDADTSSVYTSTDQGQTWTETPVPDSLGCVHMNIVQLSDGSLLAVYRSRWADFIYASWSFDEGRSFSAPVPTELPNNNSSVQAIALADGRVAMVFNNSSALNATDRRVSLYDEIDDEGLADVAEPQVLNQVSEDRRRAFWGAPRAPMTLAISADGGRSWPLRRDLEVGDGYCMTNNSRDGLNREFSYPSIRQEQADDRNGDLHIAFTYFRQAIKYVRVDVDWVSRG
jgi:predicted neuraminidase